LMDTREYARRVDELDRALTKALILGGERPGTAEADRLAARIVGTVLRASRRSGIPVHQLVKLPLREVERLGR
jgi:hypothetical protein